MGKLQLFQNPKFGQIRTLVIDGEPWFVGKDVADILGYKNTKDALITHVDDEDKRIIQRSEIATLEVPSRGLTIINESGLYSLVLSSKLPAAREFKRWITREVIPAIRKNGGYINGQQEMNPEELMAAAVLVAQRTIAERDARISALTVKNQIMAPKADYFDQLVERNTLTNFRETAKELEVSPKEFVSFLLKKKYVYRDKKGKLLPYEQKNDGLFQVKECLNEKTQWSGTQTLVTPKGRETFRLLFG